MCFIFRIFVALIINPDQHRLIDIQESPLLQSDHELDVDVYDLKLTLTLPLSSPLRRHSFQDDRFNKNFFELQFERHIQQMDENYAEEVGNHHYGESTMQIQPNALQWLRKCGVMHDKCLLYEPNAHRRLKTLLRKTSSENELLLMSQSNEQFLRGIPAIRRSFSSSLIFSNCECQPIQWDSIQTGISIC